jgi:hypothetical protein
VGLYYLLNPTGICQKRMWRRHNAFT